MAPRIHPAKHSGFALDLNQIELGPIGNRGAAAALQGLEVIEERAQARLMRAIEVGNPFQIKAAQKSICDRVRLYAGWIWQCETERRNAEEQVPMRQIEDIALQIATWLRLAFDQFLSSESRSLMGIEDHGEFLFSVIEGFRGILQATVKARLKTTPIPPWAAAQVVKA